MVRKLGAVAGAVLVLVVCSISPAFASPDANPQSGPANHEGAYAYCNLVYSGGFLDDANAVMSIACEYGPVTAVINSIRTTLVYDVAGTQTGDPVTFPAGSSSNTNVVKNGSGEYQAAILYPTGESPSHFVISTAYVTGITETFGTAGRDIGTSGTSTGPVAGHANQLPVTEVPTGFGAAESAIMPAFFWPGGTGGTGQVTPVAPPDDLAPPGTSCGSWWHIGCYIAAALAWAFVPDGASMSASMSDLASTASTRFPFSLVIDGVNLVTYYVDQIHTLTVGSTGSCTFPVEDMGSTLPFSFQINLPTADSGCSYDDTTTLWVNLYGVRVWIRTIITAFLWYVLLRRTVGAFIGGKSDEVAP